MWGFRHLTSLSESMLQERHGSNLGAFEINDDGYLVAVGEDANYREGITKGLWGTQVEVDGYSYRWGIPIVDTDADGFPVFQEIGTSAPDFNLGWLNNVAWKGFNLHTAFQAQIGGNVYNRTKQRLMQHERTPEQDQSGKPDDLKKNIDYYQTIYNRADYTQAFVEDATYLKLRSLSLQYRLNNAQLERFGLGRLASSVALGVVGRNIFTATGYTGFDPEVGNVLIREDNFDWPNTRSFTGTVEITF